MLLNPFKVKVVKALDDVLVHYMLLPYLWNYIYSDVTTDNNN
jgi:hypothetical protein